MNLAALSVMLIAQAEGEPGRVVYEAARLRDFDDPRLPVALVTVVVVALLMLVVYLYRRDTVELPKSLRTFLACLRCVALAGLLVFFLGIERRTTRQVVHNSQVAVLIDVSQSMGLSDNDDTQSDRSRSRLDDVVKTLSESPLIDDLRRGHDVGVVRFDQDTQPIVTLPKSDSGKNEVPGGDGEPSGNDKDARAAKPQVAGAAMRFVSNDDDSGGQSPSAVQPPVDWAAALAPRGTQTRLGDALDEQLRRYRSAPLAGVIVISDGAQNAGLEPSAAVEAAQLANVPVYTLGIGSTRPRRNLSVSDLLVPARAFPGDTVQITGYVQATGYAGRFIDVELRRRGIDEPSTAGSSIESQRIQVGDDGEVVSSSFEIEPDEPGRFVYQFRALAPADDDNPRDNGRESEMDVIDRKTRVLLMASGPTREYKFLRNQLYRDDTMNVDVLLQTAQPGISQDADEILSDFPSRRDDLFEYDCLVAFDPDWTQLDADQVALVDDWVSKEAGGMIVVPGPIHTAQWIRSTEHTKLRDLYPVVFQQRLTLLDDGQYGSELAWPLEFGRAGRDARFLWLGSSAEENESAWSSFPGVYGYYAVKGEKPGATVYARVDDPESGLREQRPVFIAGHFYGAGQVFYLGSGEFWRLRTLDPAYFEVLYTKLIRHVSQGRLLRGSSRGTLMVDRDRYELGETVVVRARLTDRRHEPLTEESVAVQIMRPDDSAESVKLQADGQRPGMYFGQFAVRQEGTYQVSLPESGGREEPLMKYIQVRVPDLERARPERNELLLAALANETGGHYYPRLDWAAYGGGDLPPLAQLIPNRAEVKLIKGAPDPNFAQLQMRGLLGVVAGALFLEWIVRRVNRLA